MQTSWTGRGIVTGKMEGPALLSNTAFSFLGDADIRSGKVVGEMSDIFGQSIAGKVLIVPATRGSAGAWRFLYQLKQHDTHPVAIVTTDLPDPSVVQGAMLSEIPIVSGVAHELLEAIEIGSTLRVDGDTGQVSLLR
jgi:predicted aconitase with swiveling domain